MKGTLVPITGFATKSQAVYQALREAIVSGTLPEGRRLITREVAETLLVSESPVREALRLLATEGFVRITPHVGAVVTEILDQDLEEVLFMRAGLEGVATRLAAARITADEIGGLKRLILQMEEAAAREALDRYRRLNREFHLAVYAAAGCPRLLKAIQDLWAQSERSQASLRLLPDGLPRSNREHGAIVAALARGDADQAETIARQQIFNAIEMLRRARPTTGPKGKVPAPAHPARERPVQSE